MIELVSLRVRLGGREVLRGVTSEFGPGVTALLGRNGAGKTTMIRSIAGLIEPGEGQLRVDGVDPFRDAASARSFRSQVGWMPQEPTFPGRARVLDVVRYAAWLAGIGPGQERAKAEASLERVALADHLRTRVGQLSGGQRRRVALACSTVADPRFLLLDEPSAGLDPEQRERFLRSVRDGDPERVVLISTHLMEDVLAIADRVVVVDAGVVVSSQDMGSIRASPDGDAAQALARLRHAVMGQGE